MPGRLEGKVVLVTGGASGIGAAIANRAASEGAKLFLADVDVAGGRSLAKALDASFLDLDVTSPAQWGVALDTVRTTVGRLDGLVNNAGIVSHRPIDETGLDEWNRVISVNLTGTMLGCRGAITLMRENGATGGAIVNVSSSVALLGLAGDAAYTASKNGIVGLTRSAAARCAVEGWNIRINSLHPGATMTAITQASMVKDADVARRYARMSPMGRLAKPEEIAGLAVFLLSDEAAYCTGGIYAVDGGLTATHPTG